MNEFLSESISAYRKDSMPNHDLVRLIETRKSVLDNSLIFEIINFLNRYLTGSTQNVKTKNTCIIFLKILSHVLQGSILRPIFFNIFLKKLFLCLTKSEIHNFTDDNFIKATCNHSTDLLNTVET